MKRNSLARRLFSSSALWVLLVLPFAAVVLISYYYENVERAYDTRLHQFLELLIITTSPNEGVDIVQPEGMGEPLFSLPFSGWYWEIKSPNNPQVLYKSSSLVTEVLKLPSESGVPPNAREVRKAYLPGPEQQELRVMEREILISEKKKQRRYVYVVAADANEIYAEVDDFARLLIIAFCILAIGLLAATFFQVRFGLRPVADIGAKLAAIRSGKASQLEGKLPQEIEPLQKELNALIQSNQAIIERARTHAGNLAHALKTPLSVIINEARGREGEFPAKVVEQAELMREHITHHLSRAQIAAGVSIVGGVTDVCTTLNSLRNALSRIYRERGINFEVNCPEDVKFRGEKQDLQDMMGNLLDNASKWAKSKVTVSVTVLPPTKQSTDKQLTITVDDDGPGLPPEELESVVKRGKRLDENKPGSGLGLSIVTDLSGMYDGSFKLDNLPTGGLSAQLLLPAA